MNRHVMRMNRKKRAMTAALVSSMLFIGNCPSIGFDSELGRAFREAYVPGLVQGLTTAITTPEQTEAGLRQTLTAFLDGVGTLLTPEDARNSDD